MSEKKLTLGQAIDQIVTALEGVEEKARQTAIEAACAHLNLKMAGRTDSRAAQGLAAAAGAEGVSQAIPKGGQSDAPVSAGRKIDIRTLKEQKLPNSARQMACLVAYYLQELAPEGERKESVSSKDLEKYFKQAGFKLPTKVEQVLVDAKHAGYFESPSRGEYKLNAVGYNLVAHTLPSAKAT